MIQGISRRSRVVPRGFRLRGFQRVLDVFQKVLSGFTAVSVVFKEFKSISGSVKKF